MEPRHNKRNQAVRDTRNDLPESSRAAAVELIGPRLAGAIDLRLQAKQAHWNVRGPRFISLHELFDQVASAGSSFQDLLGERIAQLGGRAAGTVEAVREATPLAPYPVDLSWEDDHVRQVTDALSRFAAAARTGILEAEQLGDDATADIFTEIARESDKLLWFVEAHLAEPEGAEAQALRDRGDGSEPPAPARH